ncbi:MAG: hypothetical protein JWP09_272 [Candidatus Taylorbacteria bacterium]|nr:hypothetical protein [Candidatus Taylorbacteria bacterium]
MFNLEAGFGSRNNEEPGRVPEREVIELSKEVELDKGVVIEPQTSVSDSIEEAPTWPAADEDTGKIPDADLKDWN